MDKRHNGGVMRSASHMMARLLALAILLASCAFPAPAHAPSPPLHWAHRHVRILVPYSAPQCAAWTLQAAWDYLSPARDVSIELSDKTVPSDGEVVVVWSKPATALGLATPWVDRATGRIVKATVQVGHCDVRLVAHELAHCLGLVNVQEHGRLMTGRYDIGGWMLTDEERVALERGLER